MNIVFNDDIALITGWMSLVISGRWSTDELVKHLKCLELDEEALDGLFGNLSSCKATDLRRLIQEPDPINWI